MKNIKIMREFSSLAMVGLLTAAVAVQAGASNTSDSAIQSRSAVELNKKPKLRNVRITVEDGIVTLTGTVDLYQQKIDAAKKLRKLHDVGGVRNLIVVAGKNVSDAELAAQLNRKLYFDRIGYDNLFNYVTASVKNGAVTLNGQTMLSVDRDSAFALAARLPGVKDVANNVTLAPVSFADDAIRADAERVIYRDSTLSKYGADPALPIRIVVDHGKLTLSGKVETQMDKNIAGIRANEVAGAFSVQNDLQVDGRS